MAADTLRVLLVCGDFRPGLDGVADYLVRLTTELRRGGTQVRVLHTGPDSGVPGARSVGRRWTLRALLRAGRAAQAAEVVHVQFAPSLYRFHAAIGMLPLVVGRVPLVVTLHEYGWWRWERRLPAAVWGKVERRGLADRESVLLVPRAARVITTNPQHTAAVARRFLSRRPPDEVPIGANVGVAVAQELPAVRAAVREELGVAAGSVLIAFFGFVHPVKGVRYLGEAVAALAAEGRDVHLLVIGGFESLALPAEEATAFERELRGQLAGVGAASRTTVPGFRSPEEVSRLLAACDVAALPFTAGVTGKSGSLLTVMAHGLPVVVTAPPEGPDPQLPDGERVVVVPRVRDGAVLAAGLRRVLDDPALAARLAASGAAWAAERDWPSIARRHIEIYADLHARGLRRRG